MEKVQYALEGTLPELKDLHEKGLFSKNEIHQVTKRRTTFETALVRRVARKEDYFKYAEYEINLEQLRKVRWKRLGYDRNPPPPSASTYSFPRRIMYILKRATAKFSGDLSVWLAYVEYASREGMRKVVASGLTSALQHHPTSPTLYLLSSYHHLHPTAPFPTSIIPSSSSTPLPSASADEDDDATAAGFAIEGTQAARTTILLGLRMIPHNRDLWREYIKLELGWVEALRRRWKILGIDAGKGRAVEDEELRGEDRDGGEGAFGPEGEDARKAILGGQLVIHAITAALDKIPAGYRDTEGDGMDFRQSLLDVFREYPSPLRKVCLETVYSHLEGIRADKKVGAKARLILITKGLYYRAYEPGRKDLGGAVLDGEALVEEYGKIGTHIRKIAKDEVIPGWSDVAGNWLVEQIEAMEENPDLMQYLVAILGHLCKPAFKPSATLLVHHLDYLSDVAAPNVRLLGTARSYAAQQPSNPELALAHLRIERAADPAPDAIELRKLYNAAIKSCSLAGSSLEYAPAVTQLWLECAAWEESQGADPKVAEATWRRILRDSLRTGKNVNGLHATLLCAYLKFRLGRGDDPSAALRDITSTYGPSADFYTQAFDSLASALDLPTMERLYESWRSSCASVNQKIDAGISFASVLLQKGKAKSAIDVIDILRRELREDPAELAELEGRWKAVLDADKAVTAESQDESDPEEEDNESEGEDGSMDVDLHV